MGGNDAPAAQLIGRRSRKEQLCHWDLLFIVAATSARSNSQGRGWCFGIRGSCRTLPLRDRLRAHILKSTRFCEVHRELQHSQSMSLPLEILAYRNPAKPRERRIEIDPDGGHRLLPDHEQKWKIPACRSSEWDGSYEPKSPRASQRTRLRIA